MIRASTRLGTHRYSGDDSQSGRGTQANTYSDRPSPQGASSDPGEGALGPAQHELPAAARCPYRKPKTAADARESVDSPINERSLEIDLVRLDRAVPSETKSTRRWSA